MENSIKYIAEHYGYSAQSMQLIEEMAELMVAINKYRRFEDKEIETINDELNREYLESNIIEEIADVEIMLSQIKYLMDCHSNVAQMKELKVARQLDRIKKENEQYE